MPRMKKSGTSIDSRTYCEVCKAEIDMAVPRGLRVQHCTYGGEAHHYWTLFPDCECGEKMGCVQCRGNGMEFSCRRCHRRHNLMNFWRELAHPFKAPDPTDAVGLVRYTSNGMPFICEADSFYRPCRIDRIPKVRRLTTNELGAYLDYASGEPLYPKEWEPA